MAEDENKTDSESDVLLQGAESVVSGKGSDDAPFESCLLYTSPSPRDISGSRMPSSA